MKTNICFCGSLLVVAALAGCNVVREPPPPPNNVDHPGKVSLDVQPGTAAGYTPTYGSNGQPYSYKFSGGDDRHGNVTVRQKEGPNVNIHVSLSGSTFNIDSVQITDDSGGQLTPPPSNSGNNVVIGDKNSGPLDAYFAIKVLDNSQTPAVTIYCDPRVVNN